MGRRRKQPEIQKKPIPLVGSVNGGISRKALVIVIGMLYPVLAPALSQIGIQVTQAQLAAVVFPLFYWLFRKLRLDKMQKPNSVLVERKWVEAGLIVPAVAALVQIASLALKMPIPEYIIPLVAGFIIEMIYRKEKKNT